MSGQFRRNKGLQGSPPCKSEFPIVTCVWTLSTHTCTSGTSAAQLVWKATRFPDRIGGDETVSGHSREVLGAANRDSLEFYPSMYPTSTLQREGLRLAGLVNIEGIPQQGTKEVVDLLSNLALQLKWLSTLDWQNLPHRFVSRLELQDPASLADLISMKEQFPELVGIRQILNYDTVDESLRWPLVQPIDYFSNESFQKSFSLMNDLDMSFDLQVNHHQLIAASKFLSHFPNIRIILDHLGLPRTHAASSSEKIHQEWLEGISALSKLPNSSIKLSKLSFIHPNYATCATSFEKVQRYVHEAIEVFGTARCMFASNFPDDDPKSATEIFRATVSMVNSYSSERRASLFSNCAKSIYKLN